MLEGAYDTGRAADYCCLYFRAPRVVWWVGGRLLAWVDIRVFGGYAGWVGCVYVCGVVGTWNLRVAILLLIVSE